MSFASDLVDAPKSHALRHALYLKPLVKQSCALPIHGSCNAHESLGGPFLNRLLAKGFLTRNTAKAHSGKCSRKMADSFKRQNGCARSLLLEGLRASHTVKEENGPLSWATPPIRLGLSGRNAGKFPETLSE